MQSEAGHGFVVLIAAAVLAISAAPRLASGQTSAAAATDSVREPIEILSVHAEARGGQPVIEFASTPAEKLRGVDIEEHGWVPGAGSKLRTHRWDPDAASWIPVHHWNPSALSRMPYKSWDPNAPSAIRVHRWDSGARSRIRVHGRTVSQMRGRRATGR